MRVDAIVTDRDGKLVSDLTAADFEVLEDGKPQAIETFKFIRLTGTPTRSSEPAREIRSDYVEETEAAREDVRMFAIFLDDYHVRRGASMVVREPLIQFLQNDLGPLDMVAIMYPLTPVADVRFSRNRDLLAGAINNFLGRKGEYEPRNDLEQQYANYPTEVVERIRNQVSLSALRGLVTRLGGLREGRKSVIVVSEGYTYYVPPELRSPRAGLMVPGQGGSTVPGGDPNEFRARMALSNDMQQDLRSVYDAANRANAALYTLDPRGLAVFEFDINERVGLASDRDSLQETQNTLRSLAEQTDGRAIVNRNDLAGGLKQAVTDSTAYYLLGYSSSQSPNDGKFHEITVRVKRPRTDVRSRKGYWAFTAEEVSRATAPATAPIDSAVTNALSALEVPRRARVIRTWLGTSRSESGNTRVTFFWEPVPAAPGERRDIPTQVAVTAIAEDGAPYFRGRVGSGASGAGGAVVIGATGPSSSAPAAAGATNGAAGGRVEFEAKPGPMRMRLSVEGDGGRVLDSDQLDITVDDFTAPQVHMSTPMVLRARTVPEMRALSANLSAPPTTERTFRRSERVLIRLSAYGPGGSAPEVTAQLLNRAGDVMSPVTVEAVAGQADLRQMSVPLASLSPGDYLVEVRAKGDDSEAKELIAFRVGS